MWHAGVDPKRFFDDSLKVFHLIQVHHCGRAVRTFKNLLLFFICLVLERLSSYIRVFRAFLVSISFQIIHSIIFKTLRSQRRQCTISSRRCWNRSNEISVRYLNYVWLYFLRLHKPTVSFLFSCYPFCCVFLLPVHQGALLVGRFPNRQQHVCIRLTKPIGSSLLSFYPFCCVFLLPVHHGAVLVGNAQQIAARVYNITQTNR